MENRTGDTTYDPLGHFATDYITEGVAAVYPFGVAADEGAVRVLLRGDGDWTPDELAAKFLDQAGPTTEVTVEQDTRVAGRDAYTLRIDPKTEDTLVEDVTLAIDAATGQRTWARQPLRGHWICARSQHYGAEGPIGFTCQSFASLSLSGGRIGQANLGHRRAPLLVAMTVLGFSGYAACASDTDATHAIDAASASSFFMGGVYRREWGQREQSR